MNDVPYIAHESALARQERTIKRLWILCIIMFLAFVISNTAWVYYENQFEDVSVEQQVESDGDSRAYVNGTGDMNIGNEDKANN